MIKDYKTPFNVNGNISYIKSTNYLMSFHLSDFSNLNLFERKKVFQIVSFIGRYVLMNFLNISLCLICIYTFIKTPRHYNLKNIREPCRQFPQKTKTGTWVRYSIHFFRINIILV